MNAIPRPRKVHLSIMSTLATGWLPWGVEWDPWLSWVPSQNWPKGERDENGNEKMKRIPAAFILCCGHQMSRKVANEFIAAGLLERFDNPKDPRECLRITDQGRAWLGTNWIS